jgi:guanine deaminase
MTSRGTIGVEATIIDAPVLGEIRIRERALVVVSETGTIEDVMHAGTPAHAIARRDLTDRGALHRFGSDEYLLPGLIDLHNHAPQWPQLGKALDVPLEDWLEGFTFPLEARYDDVAFAQSVYQSLVRSMVASGTTTAMYYATIHREATQRLVDICLQFGQRALVGKVAMDDPEGCPAYYRDPSAGAAIDETLQLVNYVTNHPDNQMSIVMPVITPRFIPSCTDDLLRGLGEVAAVTSCHVQTHCSESNWAHQYGLTRFGQTDTATYQDFGLLTPRTVLAHCNFITEDDIDTIIAAGASVAHCPLSNIFFSNAVFPAREALDAGVRVGLGTDVSGGPNPSILNASANAVAVSRAREEGVDATMPSTTRGTPGTRLTFAEALWMATTGGGLALGLPIGLLSPGYSFDAIVVDASVPDTDLMFWPGLDTPHDMLQKILNNGVRRNVTNVWVQGRQVKSPDMV